jgi:hypothetical protein
MYVAATYRVAPMMTEGRAMQHDQHDTPFNTADRTNTTLEGRYPQQVTLQCNECGKKRKVSVDGNFNDRCPRCGGVDWDVL